MPKTPTTGFRLAPALIERVDEYAARLSEATGIPVSRAAAVTKLLTAALDAEESRKTTARPRR